MDVNSRLMLRLPVELHQSLQERAAAHERSLNGEIVYALRRYVRGVTEIRHAWDGDGAGAADWEALAGETLDGEEGWDFTNEERASVDRLLSGQRVAP